MGKPTELWKLDVEGDSGLGSGDSGCGFGRREDRFLLAESKTLSILTLEASRYEESKDRVTTLLSSYRFASCVEIDSVFFQLARTYLHDVGVTTEASLLIRQELKMK